MLINKLHTLDNGVERNAYETSLKNHFQSSLLRSPLVLQKIRIIKDIWKVGRVDEGTSELPPEKAHHEIWDIAGSNPAPSTNAEGRAASKPGK